MQTTVAFTSINTYVGVASGTACTGGTCGYQQAIYSSDLTTQLCITQIGTSGNGTANLNINTTGVKVLTFANGADVSAGVCTLPVGHYLLVSTSDSTALRIVNYENNGLNAGSVLNTNFPRYWGGSTAVISTGNGASLALNSNLSGVTFTANVTTLVAGFEK